MKLERNFMHILSKLIIRILTKCKWNNCILFDYVLISWVTNNTCKHGFSTCYDIEKFYTKHCYGNFKISHVTISKHWNFMPNWSDLSPMILSVQFTRVLTVCTLPFTARLQSLAIPDHYLNNFWLLWLKNEIMTARHSKY